MSQPLLNALDFAATLGLGALLLLLLCALVFALRGVMAVRRDRTADVPSDPTTWWNRQAKAKANESELSE